MCNKGITQFYLPPTHQPYLLLLPSRKASPPFGRYQLVLLGDSYTWCTEPVMLILVLVLDSKVAVLVLGFFSSFSSCVTELETVASQEGNKQEQISFEANPIQFPVIDINTLI